MEIVIHRANKVQSLKEIPKKYGCEIDIRAQGSKLILHHDPFANGDFLDDYLDVYQHGLLVLNIKEAGIESDVLKAVRSRGINKHFLLDVEFPYIYRASRAGERAIAIRYSEDEPIELVNNYAAMVDWVWIDTNTILPLNPEIVHQLKGMSTCLVCPERWGRPGDILVYRQQMKALDFMPTAVMTHIDLVHKWEQPC
jgi:hypothetical protein